MLSNKNICRVGIGWQAELALSYRLVSLAGFDAIEVEQSVSANVAIIGNGKSSILRDAQRQLNGTRFVSRIVQRLDQFDDGDHAGKPADARDEHLGKFLRHHLAGLFGETFGNGNVLL